MRKIVWLIFISAIGLYANFNNVPCGTFKSGIVSLQEVQVEGVAPKLCGTTVIEAENFDDPHNNLHCYQSSNCTALSTCQIKKPTQTLYRPTLLHSNKRRGIPRRIRNTYTFRYTNYNSYTFRDNENILDFKATQQYEQSNTAYMTLGKFTFTGDDNTLIFYPGDYYFDELRFEGDRVNIILPEDGQVRIFVNGNIEFEKDSIFINADGEPKNLFIYADNDFKIKNGGYHRYQWRYAPKIKAYLYARDDVVFESDSEYFTYYGNIVAEGNIKLEGDYIHIIASEMAECSACDNASVTVGGRDFAIRFKENITGNVYTIGNSVLCPKNRNGECISDTDVSNTSLDLRYIDVDNNSSTFNSSKAKLNIPSGRKTLFVGLYAQGYVDDTSSVNQAIEKLKNPILVTIEKTQKTISVCPEQIDLIANTNRYTYTTDGYTYSIFSEIKELENIDTDQINDWITVANIYANEGTENTGLGNFGAWTLIVVYEDPKGQDVLRNVTIYDGYKKISYFDNMAYLRLQLDGFFTPKYGDIDSKLMLFVGEGDKYITGDHFYFNNTNISHQTSGVDNAFYSHIDETITRYPSIVNNNGIDIQIYNIGNTGENALNLMQHNQSEADFEFRSQLDSNRNAEAFFPSMATFTTQLYKPKVCYIETISKNGKPLENSVVTLGDTLTSKIIIKNDDNEEAYNIKIEKLFDNNISSYKQNSIYIKDTDFENKMLIRDNTEYNGVRVSYENLEDSEKNLSKLTIAYLGSGNYPTTLYPYSTHQDSIEIDYNFTINSGNPFDNTYFASYSYQIGSQTYTVNTNLPKCYDFNNTIVPYIPSDFNVVHFSNWNAGDRDPASSTDPRDALYTQIVGQEFNVSLVHFDANHLMQPVNGVAFLEVVDGSTITEDSQSCKEAAIAFDLPKSNYAINFNNTFAVHKTVTINNAIKKARFRVRYIDWEYLSKKYDKSCLATDSKDSLLKGIPQCISTSDGIKEIFPNTPCVSHAATGAPCDENNRGVGNAPYDHPYGCLHCLVDNHGSSSCSADEFAVRPANYAMEANESILIGKRSYLLKIYATDIEDNNISGYTTTFNTAEQNVTVQLSDLTKPCHYTQSQELTGIIFNNGLANYPYFTFNDVGEVNVTVIDGQWSGVDTIAKSDGSIDCIADSNTTVPDENGKIGCLIKGIEQFRFNPKKFKNSLQLLNSDPINNITYLSNDPAMHADANITITALLDDDTIANNYSQGCYANDVNISLWIINNKPLTWGNTQDRIIYFNNPASFTTLNVNDDNITLQSSESNFTQGSATVALPFNFLRKVDVADTPFQIDNTDFNLTVTENSFAIKGTDFDRTQTSQAIFVYARIHSPDESINKIDGNEGEVSIYFEIYNPIVPIQSSSSSTSSQSCGGFLPINMISSFSNIFSPSFSTFLGSLTDGVDSTNWKINKYHTSSLGNVYQILYQGSDILTSSHNPLAQATIYPMQNGKRSLKLIYTGNNYPFTVNLEINASSWLIYNKYNSSAQTNSFTVRFTNPGIWMGVGDEMQPQNEINQSRYNKYRINW